jgi:hypothetical protein
MIFLFTNMIKHNQEQYYYQLKRNKADDLFIYPLSILMEIKALTNDSLFELLFKFLYLNLTALTVCGGTANFASIIRNQKNTYTLPAPFNGM